MGAESLNLRDIHLPEPISWWPIAPGWWLIIVSVILIAIVSYLVKVIKQKRKRQQQLPNDIKVELEKIKQQFQKTHNKVQLAKALSILLRRASISYFPEKNIAGLTGENWLAYLDKTLTAGSTKEPFHSDIGKILLSAPYLPDTADLSFDAQALITLCESWLYAPHKSDPFADTLSASSSENIADAIADKKPDKKPENKTDINLNSNTDLSVSAGSDVTAGSGDNITQTSPLSRVSRVTP